jgi:hypothetical protein
MIRITLMKTKATQVPLSTTIVRSFSAKTPLSCNARIGQILEQARSVLPVAYKTVKTTTQSSKADTRRNQLIWLVKQSQGKDAGAANKEPSPHERPWTTTQPKADGVKTTSSWEGLTVWPHMW